MAVARATFPAQLLSHISNRRAPATRRVGVEEEGGEVAKRRRNRTRTVVVVVGAATAVSVVVGAGEEL